MNLTEQAENVRFWHAHHTPEFMEAELGMDKGTECELFNAIQAKVPDGELVMLALEVDADCVETEGE